MFAPWGQTNVLKGGTFAFRRSSGRLFLNVFEIVPIVPGRFAPGRSFREATRELHQLDIWTCTAQNCSESSIAMFRWCCDHLHLARNFSGTFLAWWRWSQHHRNIAIKDSEQFWAVHVRISSWCITTTTTMTLKLYITNSFVIVLSLCLLWN